MANVAQSLASLPDSIGHAAAFVADNRGHITACRTVIAAVQAKDTIMQQHYQQGAATTYKDMRPCLITALAEHEPGKNSKKILCNQRLVAPRPNHTSCSCMLEPTERYYLL